MTLTASTFITQYVILPLLVLSLLLVFIGELLMVLYLFRWIWLGLLDVKKAISEKLSKKPQSIMP